MKYRPLLISLVFLVFFNVRAIAQRESLGLESLGEFGFTPADPQAKLGLEYIFAGRGFRLFVPDELFTKLITFDRRRQWVVYGNAPSPRSRAFGGDDTSGKDVGLSYASMEKDGDRYISFTCFQCHAGLVAGRLIAGVGNAHIDQYALLQDLSEFKKVLDFYERRTGLGKALIDLVGELSDEKKEHLRYFSLYSETILRPALKGASARGDDYGPFPVWQLMARMKDPSKTGFDVHDFDDSTSELKKREALVSRIPLGPVDRRPWWLRKHDTKSYVYGDTLALPHAGKDFAINFTVPHKGHNETYAERSREISQILEFALRTEAPRYPRFAKLNAAKIDAGASIYDSRCSRCHGKYAPNPSDTHHRWVLKYRSLEYQGANPQWKGKHLPDVLYSTGVDPEWTENTDETYSRALQWWGGTNPDTHQPTGQGLTGYVAGIRDFFAGPPYSISVENLPAVYNPRLPGYRAPPLVGIWASAPYLHNGSVPTLKDLFEYYEVEKGESLRPPVWAHVVDATEAGSYDFAGYGLVVEFPKDWKMPKKPDAPFDHVESTNYRLFYDTSQVGKSNKGAVTCGPNLKDKREKDAVLEFLLSLSDETVRPE